MDCPCGKFGDCIVSTVLVLSCVRHTDRQTDRQTDADERFTPATVVDISSMLTERFGKTAT